MRIRIMCLSLYRICHGEKDIYQSLTLISITVCTLQKYNYTASTIYTYSAVWHCISLSYTVSHVRTVVLYTQAIPTFRQLPKNDMSSQFLWLLCARVHSCQRREIELVGQLRVTQREMKLLLLKVVLQGDVGILWKCMPHSILIAPLPAHLNMKNMELWETNLTKL